MKWLVTGGAGFIGSHLCEELLARGEKVVAVDDLSTGCIENIEHLLSRGLEFHRKDVRDFTIERFDQIVHLAAVVGVQRVLGRPLETMRTNMEATAAVLGAAAGPGTPVLLASTSEVYAKNTPPFRETDDLVLGPTHVQRWGYAVGKLADEHLARGYHLELGLPVRIVRLFNTVGPRQLGRYGMVLPRFVRAALDGTPLRVHGDGSQTRCFTHVADVVQALLRLATEPCAVGHIYNVGSAETISIGALAARVVARVGSTSSIQYIPYSSLGREFEDSPARLPDTSRLRAFGWAPKWDLNATIDDVVAWERSR